MKKICIYIILLLTIISCAPTKRLQWYNKRIEKIANNNSIQLKTTETITVHDTVYIEPERITDTLVTNEVDTIVIENERLRIDIRRLYDTLYVDAECKADTIYRTKEIEVEKTNYIVHDFNYYGKWILGILIAILVILGVLKVGKKLIL